MKRYGSGDMFWSEGREGELRSSMWFVWEFPEKTATKLRSTALVSRTGCAPEQLCDASAGGWLRAG